MNRILKCDKYRITQYFSSKHKGIDVVGRKDDHNITCPIKAHTAGQVVWIQTGQKHNNNLKPGTNATYGNAVKLKHSNGYYTLYAHMKEVYVKKNQKVKEGQEIGYMGNTGVASANHLHWEVRKHNEERINPRPYINDDLPGMKKKYKYQSHDKVEKKWLPEVIIGSDGYAGNPGHAADAFRVENAVIKAHDLEKKYWLPEVKSYKDYAGNYNHAMDGIMIKSLDPNIKLEYRVQLVKNKKMLSWVSGYDTKDSKNGYAGILGEPIACIYIREKK